MSHCQSCPLGLGGPCIGERVPALCGRPEYRDTILDWARQAKGEYPPLTAQAGNLARALWDWAVSGFTMASEDEQARRLMVCAGCSYFEPAAQRCRLCGCHLLGKVQLKTGHCPLPEPKW